MMLWQDDVSLSIERMLLYIEVAIYRSVKGSMCGVAP
jgi:hypothetical protein